MRYGRATCFALAVAAFAFVACASHPHAVRIPPHSPSTAKAAAPAPATASGAPSASEPAASALTNAAPLPLVPAPTSRVANTRIDASWSQCQKGYKATAKDVLRDVATLGRGCAKATNMKPIGQAVTGKQADQDKPETFPLEAKANHCYRAYAQAGEGVQDLDLVIVDSAGVILGEDMTDGPSAVVLEEGAVCFTKDDKASVVVSVGMGSGAFAVQIWGD